jgi:predicted secreted hydrolase
MTGGRLRLGGLVLLAGAILVLSVATVLMRPSPAGDPPSGGPDRAEALAAFLAESAPTEAAAPRGPWALSLPRDHGSHPEAPAETWVVSASMTDADGARFDLFLSLLRYGGATGQTTGGGAATPWDISTLWAGQVVLIPSTAAPVIAAERFARIAGAAGHDATTREVWLEDWTISYGMGREGAGLRLQASAGDARLDLALSPEKPPLATEASDAPGPRGFAMPRLSVSGSVAHDDQIYEMTGTGWLDRSWGDLPVPGGPLAYDRLILHLSDGSELSLLRTRRIGRAGVATLDAVLVDPEGEATALDAAALALEVRNAEGDAATAWRLTGAGVDLTARVERWTTREFLAPVRLGPAEVEGQIDGVAVQGRGMLVLSEGAEG